MQDESSPFSRAKELDAHVTSVVMRFDIDALPAAEQELLKTLKRLATDIRLDIRDYGLAETRAEQTQMAEEMTRRLAALEQLVAKAGELSMLSPVDVAHLSALTQQLVADLR
ncbi:MAG TPA: hypothetical protein VJP80_08085 [Candidatus Saccharimonadales bacterium]|nr:hypothetical protein [Candidatus Saccharimonadales bacterium]